MAASEDQRKGCPNRKLNAERCPCEIRDCPRLGLCCECIEFHRKLNEVPACIAGTGKPARMGAGEAAAGPRGDDFRLTDFASCAG